MMTPRCWNVFAIRTIPRVLNARSGCASRHGIPTAIATFRRWWRRPGRMAEPTATAAVPGANPTHLGIVIGLAMGPAVGLGLGRFAYALLLPAMRLDLGWSY